jgi:TrmH family RNA methyltransferase
LSGASEQLGFKNPRVQRLRRLLARRDVRQAEGRFVLEGVKLLEEASLSRTRLEEVYVAAGWERACSPGLAARLQGLLERLQRQGAEVSELAPGVLQRVADSVAPQPVLAVAEVPVGTFAGLLGSQPKVVVVSASVQDPGNLGTLVRTAWAAGADALVSCPGTADPWGPKAVRASAGGVFHLPVVAAPSTEEALSALASCGLVRLAAVAQGGEDYALADLARPVALVVGNESAGLPLAGLSGHIDGLVSVPMPGGAESLNVAAAAAVVLFEAARQRSGRGALRSVATTGEAVATTGKLVAL